MVFPTGATQDSECYTVARTEQQGNWVRSLLSRQAVKTSN